VVTVLVSFGSSGPVSSSGRGHFVVFLGEPLNLCVSPPQVYKWVTAGIMLGAPLQWTSIPSRGSRNTPSRFMLLKPDKLRTDGPLNSYADLTSLTLVLCIL